MSRARVRLLTLVLAVLAAVPAWAQFQTGSILVRVADEQGAAVPGVSVTLSSDALVAGTMAGITDSGGVYRFPSLPPGTYSVKVDLQGFRGVVREGVQVQVGQTVPLDLKLLVATVAESVTVTGSSPVVDTTTANTSVNLGEQLLQGHRAGATSGRWLNTRCRACSSRAPTSAARRVDCRASSTRAAPPARRIRAT